MCPELSKSMGPCREGVTGSSMLYDWALGQTEHLLYTKLTAHFIKNLSLYKLVSYNEIVTIFRRNKLNYIWNINK